jgi:hypothetical protein
LSATKNGEIRQPGLTRQRAYPPARQVSIARKEKETIKVKISGTENIREDLNTAVVDAVGRVNDLNQLAANIAVAANLMRDAIQEIENELMEIISRLNQHMR